MNMDIWVVGTSNQLFIREFYTEKNFQENKVVPGKTGKLWSVHFLLPILFVLTLVSVRAVLCKNIALSTLVLWNKIVATVRFL